MPILFLLFRRLTSPKPLHYPPNGRYFLPNRIPWATVVASPSFPTVIALLLTRSIGEVRMMYASSDGRRLLKPVEKMSLEHDHVH
jgi:hypothetical protein